MASLVPPPNDKKRVKVYELRNNDWFDRGTGFCTGHVVNVRTCPLFCRKIWLVLHGQQRSDSVGRVNLANAADTGP